MRAVSVASYAALRNRIRETLLLGQQKIQEAKVQTYWQTGRYINQHVQANGGRAEYGREIIRKLAEDIDLHPSVLQRCSQFAEKFSHLKIVAGRRQFNWSHYRALITVVDEKQMLELVRKAEQGNWTSEELEIRIRNLNRKSLAETSDGKALSILPIPAPGPFFIYKIIRPETIHSKSNELLIDLGFSTVLELNRVSKTSFKPGTLVTSLKNSKGNYSLKIPSPLPLPKGEDKGEGAGAIRLLYTYQAFVERVLDGDTLKVEIDLGFNIRIRQTIRLRGIDCPELDAPDGRAAKRFVERALAPCGFITVKSVRTRKEKWGRYLGDIFYTDKTGKQVYLNNLLLENGMAVRVRN